MNNINRMSEMLYYYIVSNEVPKVSEEEKRKQEPEIVYIKEGDAPN